MKKKTDICLLKRYLTLWIVAAYSGWSTTLFLLIYFEKSILVHLPERAVMQAHSTSMPGIQCCFDVRPMSKVSEPPSNQHWVSLMWLIWGFIISAGMQLNTQ